MEGGAYVCEFCNKPYSLDKSLKRHLRRVHFLLSSVEGMLSCPLTCGESVRYYKSLRSHLQSTHNVRMEKEDHYFQTMADFERWKQDEEAASSSLYVLNSAARKVKQGKKFYYRCHRSGFFKSSSTGKRPGRSLASTKMGSACPSTMCVMEYDEDGYVHVEFWKTHVGHCKEVGFTTISASERGVLAGKNSEGTYKKTINVFNTEYHPDEGISVGIFVHTLGVVGGMCNPVLYYKPQNENDEENELAQEDTMLILMTKFQKHMLQTYGCDKLCIDIVPGKVKFDYYVIAISAIDEYDSGCPVAYCITNRVDALAMRKFFCVLLSCYGNMYCRVLMTGISSEIHTSWSEVMGSPEYHLWSTWDVEKMWRVNLHRSRMPKLVKTVIYKTLREMLLEEDKYTFKQLFQNFVNDHANDETVECFMEYFSKVFASRPESWAHCHWTIAGISTNMYLESLHNALFYCCALGKKNKRLDYCILTILKLSRDIVLNRLIEMFDPETAIEMITNSHKQAASTVPAGITLHSNGTYDVKSNDSNSVLYKVTKEISKYCDCKLRCNECNICIHTFSCTCADFLVNYNICEHIHSCVLHSVDENVVIENPNILSAENNSEEVSSSVPEVEPEPPAVNHVQDLQHLTEELLNIIHSQPDMADDLCQLAIHHVKEAINTLQTQQVVLDICPMEEEAVAEGEEAIAEGGEAIVEEDGSAKSTIYIVHV